MEILDLELCDFIQYKPEELTWPGPVEFVVTHVVRDRQWFAEKLPIMEAFWKRVLWHREHGVEGLIKPPAPKKTRAKKVPPPPVCCIIDCEEDLVEGDEEQPQEAAPREELPTEAPREEDQPDVWDHSYF